VGQTKVDVKVLANTTVGMIEDVYEGIDYLNGVLLELVEELDREHESYEEINDFYISLPTHSTMDSIIKRLKDLQGEK
jgi:hypothetical protein